MDGSHPTAAPAGAFLGFADMPLACAIAMLQWPGEILQARRLPAQKMHDGNKGKGHAYTRTTR